MSSTVHWRRNSSAGRTVCPWGVRAAWKAYRWLLNISPADPRAFFFSKLKTWATPSNTIASSPITANLLGGRQEGELAPCLVGQPVGGPRLVPHDLDPRAGHPGQVGDALGDLADQVGRERAPAGGQQQLDGCLVAVQGDRADQPHVHHGQALLLAAG